MKNKFILTVALAIGSTALIPVATANATANKNIDEIVILKDGKYLSISRTIYTQALIAKFLTGSEIKFIHLDNKYYDRKHYSAAIIKTGSIEAALNYLSNSSIHDSNLRPEKGEFENGQLVPACDEAGEFTVCSFN